MAAFSPSRKSLQLSRVSITVQFCALPRNLENCSTLIFLPAAASENALYSADLTEPGKAFSFHRERLFAKRSLERSRKCQIAILPRVCKAREERHFKMISSDHAE